jgi:hypothetical protein
MWQLRSKLLLGLILIFFVSPGRSQNTSMNAPEGAGIQANAPSANVETAGQRLGNIQVPDAASAGEDWTTLRVPGELGKRMPAAEAVDLDDAVYPEFTRELLRLQWRPLDALDLWVIKPTGVKKPPVILYLYSFPSDTNIYVSNELCKTLTERGFAAVGFASALTGHRYHDRPTKQWFVSQLQESLATSVHDVQFILDYLSDRGDLDMTRVGMWGDGSGASIAIMAAAVDSRIKVLDLLDPWGDWPNWLTQSTLVPDGQRAEYLKPEFLKKVEDLDPVKWLPELHTQQIRLQYVNTVKVTPDAAKKNMEAAAPPKTTVVRYQNLQDLTKNAASAGSGFEWIKQQLEPVAPGQARNEAIGTEAVPVKGVTER